MTLDVGAKAPDFTMPKDGEGTLSLSKLKGKKVVLYFYPKDSTPGCTKQGETFRDHYGDFKSHNTEIIGVSKDSIKSHDKFKDKYNFPFPLASDQDTDVCEQYGVWVEKSMYGRKYMGIERSTFLINEEGNIEKVWRKVKVPGHVEDVLTTVKQAS